MNGGVIMSFVCLSVLLTQHKSVSQQWVVKLCSQQPSWPGWLLKWNTRLSLVNTWLGQERRQATMLAGPTDGWRADYRETTQHSIRHKEAQILLIILVLMWEFLQWYPVFSAKPWATASGVGVWWEGVIWGGRRPGGAGRSLSPPCCRGWCTILCR